MKAVKSVLFIQHGDFRDAYLNFERGHDETYRDQKKSVDFVSSLAPEWHTTIVTLGAQEYWTELAPNLWAGGVRRDVFCSRIVSDLFDRVAPTHVVLRSPHQGILAEVSRRKIWLLPCFADIFRNSNVKDRWRNWKVRHLLSKANTPCISNHSLNASHSLVSALKVPPYKVVPWDWSKIPSEEAEKKGVQDTSRPSAFFAGKLSEEKGLSDCLRAISTLRDEGVHFILSVAGPGDLTPWRSLTETLGIEKQVEFLGTIPNAQVRDQMRRHDFVIVPSRHSYPEGLPNTIYEALASRSVLIMSDHPAFLGRTKHGQDCLVFQASNPADLAKCLKRATEDSDCYEFISRNTLKAHESLYVGMEWSSLIKNFLYDPEDLSGWVGRNSLQTLTG